MPSNKSEEEAESLAELAKRELRETPEVKLHALAFMKEWIKQNSDIVNVKTGTIKFFTFRSKCKMNSNRSTMYIKMNVKIYNFQFRTTKFHSSTT